jgi:hypothetical protein
MSSRQRRRKKHRGTQAGTVRQRSRRSSASRSTGNLTPAEQRRQRLERPPSWRAAMNRAGISAAVFFAVLVLVLKQTVGAALGLALFMLLIYIPMGYAIDSFIYRWRQRRKQREEAESST